MKEKIRELEEKCGYYETSCVDKALMSKVEHKMRDLESKLEFETTFKTRLQVSRGESGLEGIVLKAVVGTESIGAGQTTVRELLERNRRRFGAGEKVRRAVEESTAQQQGDSRGIRRN